MPTMCSSRFILGDIVDIQPITLPVSVIECLNGVISGTVENLAVSYVNHIYLYCTGAEFLKIEKSRQLVTVVLTPAAVPGFQRVRAIEISKGL